LSFYQLNFDNTAIDFLDGTFLALLAEGNTDFWALFHDYQFQFFDKPGGLFTVEAVTERFNKIYTKNHMNVSMISELARWGYVPDVYWLKQTPYWTYAQWVTTWNNFVQNWLPSRTSIVVSQYQAKGWRNTVGGFIWSLSPETFYPIGTNLVITSFNPVPNGRFYYTTDGQDPRLFNQQASIYANSQSIAFSQNGNTVVISSLQQTQKITGRIRYSDGTWGPVDSLTVSIGTLTNNQPTCLLCGNIIFTEVHYHPLKNVQNKSHFIEVKNIGNTPLVMTGATIRGIRNYTFPVLTLQPGQFWVIGFYWENFKIIYSKYPDDVQFDRLSPTGDGDRYRLIDQFGTVVFDFSFTTVLPWPEITDGYGYSLVAKPEHYQDIAANALTGDDSNAQYWRYSATTGGSPWADDVLQTPRNPIPVQITYVSYFTKIQYVILINPTKQDVDMSGWVFAKSYTSSNSYTFPDGTILKAGASLNITSDVLGFSLGKGPKEKEFAIFYAMSMPDGNYVTTGDFYEFIPLDLELKRSVVEEAF